MTLQDVRIWGIALFVSILMALHITPWRSAPKWNGAGYQNSIQQMIDNGLHPTLVDPLKFSEFSRAQWVEGFVHVCIFWLFSTSAIFRALGLSAQSFSLTVEMTLGLSVFGWALYRLMRDRFEVSATVSCLAMVGALSIVPVTILFYVRAHPEPWVLVFTVGMAHAYLGDQRLRFFVFLLLGLLCKQSILPALAILLLADVFSLQRSTRELAVWLGVAVVALILQWGITRWIAWPPSIPRGPSLFSELLQSHNYRTNLNRNWDYFLRNFDLFWIFFSIGILRAPLRTKAQAFFALSMSFALLVISSDWWRNLYASLIWLVVPVGAAFFDREVWEKLTPLEKTLFCGGLFIALTRRFDTLRLQTLGFSFCACAAVTLLVMSRSQSRLRS